MSYTVHLRSHVGCFAWRVEGYDILPPFVTRCKQSSDHKFGDEKIRRNTMATLQQEVKEDNPTSPMERQATVPHGYNVSVQLMGSCRITGTDLIEL